MIEIRPLTGIGFETMTEAFNDAFSDYAIPANYTVDYLTKLVTRRGYRPDLSFGAFDDQRLAGFVFNGLDGDAAYDTGTGVVLSHRRQGLARRLMEHSIETLPAKKYVLEVIETNVRAAALYLDLGFVETRRFQCWTYESKGDPGLPDLDQVDLDRMSEWFDMPPSWQNSPASIRRAIEPYVALGNEEGVAIVFPSNGDLALLAVARDARRKGLGRSLLDAAAMRAGRPLRILNIDDRSTEITAFLQACGATRTVRQIEMVHHRDTKS